MNLLQLVAALKNGNGAASLASIMPQEMANTPMGQNVMGMAQNNDSKGLEQIARNICKEKGVDPDQAYSSIAQLFSK